MVLHMADTADREAMEVIQATAGMAEAMEVIRVMAVTDMEATEDMAIMATTEAITEAIMEAITVGTMADMEDTGIRIHKKK